MPKEDPFFCNTSRDQKGNCRVGWNGFHPIGVGPKPLVQQFWLRGSLVADNFSNLFYNFYNRYGFEKRVIKEDPWISSQPPTGYPVAEMGGGGGSTVTVLSLHGAPGVSRIFIEGFGS
jgi:hypothetical protein